MKLALMYSSLKSSPPPPALLMVEATPLFKILVLLPRSLTRVWSSGKGGEKLIKMITWEEKRPVDISIDDPLDEDEMES